MATYKSKNRQFQTESRLYTTKLIFNTYKRKRLNNGLTINAPVEAFRRYGAPYKNTQTLIANIQGFDSKTDFTYAVRKTSNDPLSRFDFDTSMIVTIDGYNSDELSFTIQNLQVAGNDSKNAYHLITIRKKN